MQIHLPKSIPGSATIQQWHKKPGEQVRAGDTLVSLETETTQVHLQAPTNGTITHIQIEAGKTVTAETPLGTFESGKAMTAPPPPPTPQSTSSTAVSGIVPILMPQAGNTMEEGTIVKWRVKEGDTIAVGQVICEIETDKATIEFESTDAGKLAKIVAKEGDVVPVKQPIALLGERAAADAYSATAPVSASPAPVAIGTTSVAEKPAAVVARSATDRVKASPAARKIAVERHIDLATVGTGSGPEGRILSTDLAGAGVLSRTNVGSPTTGGRRAMSKMRKAIALNLQTSKQTVPHFYVKVTINADPLMAFYRAQKPVTGCTLNDVVLLAVGRVVAEFPAFRTRVEGNDLVENAAANIGVAVSVADGLVVPVVVNVQALSLKELAGEARRVVEAARGGKIENMGKGVFTISNMGMLGVEEFSAIINPPESGILAIAAVREAVIVKDGAMRAGRVMTMTLSVDHRVVDGAVAAQFMARLRELLESPETLVATGVA